jgi:hypothetical protein
MADELDELVAHDLEVLADVEVPELWERIVSLADTERVDNRRPRSRWPLAAAAAVVVALVALGLVVWTGDDSTPADEPPPAPPAAGDDNTVRIAMRGADIDVDATASAGWVSFAITNQTDRIRSFEVYPLLEGQTYDDVESAAAVAVDGDPDAFEGIAAEEPVVGGFSSAGGMHTVGVAVEAGDYVVVSTELDGDLQYVPDSAVRRELRITPGDAGQAPTPTLTYQLIGDTPIGDTSTPAGRATITLDDGDGPPLGLILADLRDGASRADWDRWSPWMYPNPAADFYAAPVDSMIVLWGSTPGRTLTMDLDRGPIVLLAGPDLAQLNFMSAAFIEVDSRASGRPPGRRVVLLSVAIAGATGRRAGAQRRRGAVRSWRRDCRTCRRRRGHPPVGRRRAPVGDRGRRRRGGVPPRPASPPVARSCATSPIRR